MLMTHETLDPRETSTVAPQDTQQRLRLYDVTLDWCPGDDEQGDYGSSVWATSPDEAVRLVAEEMVDSGERELLAQDDAAYEDARQAMIEEIVAGASLYAAIDVASRIMTDVTDLITGSGDASAIAAVDRLRDIRSIDAIMKKYLG
jgi:hypothetical protein